jgi:uncharacterized membrane protein
MTQGSLEQSPQPTAPSPAPAPQSQPQVVPGRELAQIVYILQAVGIFIGLSWVAGAIVNYVKRDEPRADWVRSHFEQQQSSFWIWLVGVLLAAVLKAKFAWLAAAAVTIWLIVRIVKGWTALREGRPAPAGWI